MSNLFTLVLTASMYASIVGIVLLILKTILKHRINPRWQYILWAVLILKLLIPFGPESALSLFNKVPDLPKNVDFTQIYEEYHQSYNTVAQSGDKSNIPSTWTVRDSSLGLAAAAEKVLPYVWFAGVFLMMGWLFYTGFSLKRKISKSAIPVPEGIGQLFIQCKQRVGITRDIDIVMQDFIETPSIFGLIKPSILLSPDTLKLSNNELSYVLLHELAHYKRKDLVANHLLLVLQTIHWFNPFLWYCFKRIRQDMELAADEQVLGLLEANEQKEYGKALLSVVEHFNLPRLAPRLIGMVDDKKSIKKRINVIKMMGFFKKRRRVILVVGVLCIAILSTILLTSGLTLDTKNLTDITNEYNAGELIEFKSPYVGDSSNVANLLNSLPLAESRGEISLKTEKQPYGITVNYDFCNSVLTGEEIAETCRNNAAVIFALIDNVDELAFDYVTAGGKEGYSVTREQLQQCYAGKFKDYARNESSLQTLINSFDLSFAVYPEKYTPAMSSTPGIRILPQYGRAFDRVSFTTPYGSLLTWGKTTGQISQYGKKASLDPNVPVYWSALGESGLEQAKEIPIIAQIYYRDQIIAEKQINIRHEGMYSPVMTADIVIADDAALESQNPKNLDQAVSLAVLNQGKGYAAGETSTEGHIILDTEKKDGITRVYTISSYGAFGFENGIFTKISGSGAIASVITFSGNEQTGYSLVSYQEPQDGSLNLESKKEMFPRKLWNKVLSEQNYYKDLANQQENQAGEYLRKINRVAEVNADYVEKQLPKISVEASNQIFGEFTKNDRELNNFPYWLGTRELIQDGIRYIYETSHSKTTDGKDRISFVKRSEDGNIVKEYHYEIIGNEPRQIK